MVFWRCKFQQLSAFRLSDFHIARRTPVNNGQKKAALSRKILLKGRKFEFGANTKRVGGDSSGIAFCAAVISLTVKEKIKDGWKTALTGRLMANGDVKGVGGLNQKVIAAILSEIEKVFVPGENF